MLSGIHYHFKIVLGVTIHVCVDVDGAHAGTFTCTLSLLVTIKDWTYALFLGSFQNWRRRGEHYITPRIVHCIFLLMLTVCAHLSSCL